MMDEEKRHREVEKRERLIQTFLIISGFLVAYTGEDLVAYTGEEFKHPLVVIFSGYLIFTILYYVFLSRTINYRIIDLLALFSSWSYSLLILFFLHSQLTDGFGNLGFCYLFFSLTAIFTFSLLSPVTCERIDNCFKKQEEKIEEKHLRPLKVILNIMFIIGVIVIILIFIVVTIMMHNILV